MAVKCWAAQLGDCSGGQSREHYFTKGASPEIIGVGGFDWLKGETRLLPRDAICGHVLCASHNSRLQQLDDTAISFYAMIEELIRVLENRQRFKGRGRWNLITSYVDGDKFERWLGKLTVGFFCTNSKNGQWYQNQKPELEPPLSIVRAIFGIKTFTPPMGFYTQLPGPSIEVDLDMHTKFEGLELINSRNGRRGLGGADITVKGFKYRLWLTDKEVVPDASNLSYKVDRQRFFTNGATRKLSHQIKY